MNIVRFALGNYCIRFAIAGSIVLSSKCLYALTEPTTPVAKKEATSAAPSERTISIYSPEKTIPFGSSSISKKSSLEMQGYDHEFMRSFTFKNTSNTNCTINSINFEKKDNCFEFSSVEPGGSLPVEVAPGQSFSVRVAFHAVDRDILCSNRLLIATEQEKEPIAYPIQAMQQPLSAMSWNQKKDQFTVSLKLDQSKRSVSIDVNGHSSCDIEIISPDGQKMASQKNVTQWSWNGISTDGSKAPAGMYFARVIGRDSNGKVIMKTDRFTLSK